MNLARRSLLALAATTAAALLLAAIASATTVKRPGGGVLSSRLALVSKPSFGQFSPSGQARMLSLPARGPGSLLRAGRAYVVDVRVSSRPGASADRLGGLAGVGVLGVSARYATVTAAARAGALRRLARQSGVEAVTEELTPMASGRSTSATTCHGSVTSEGLAQLHADQVQDQFGDLGAGVKIGILSDSFDRAAGAATHAAGDVATGDLPGSGNPCGRGTAVQVLDDSFAGEDEGRGMLQIVHDLAPDAQLAFATAFISETSFASNIRALASAGAKVIADDVSYFDEPFFQDGPVAVAVNDVTAGGVTYFSSAGNNNLIDSSGRNIASWEAPSFRNSAACPSGVPAYAIHCMDFDPGAGVDRTFGITVDPGSTVRLDLQWAQPWNGVTTDLDAYLLTTGGTLIAKSENFNVGTTQKPFEFLAATNSGGTPVNVNFAINRCDTSCGGGDAGTPRLKFALLENGGGVSETEYPASSGGDVVGPTIFGHNGAANAMSTAAVPFNNSNAVESYSSRGPLTLYFGPVIGTTPAPPISPVTLNKPDIAATDCGRTTFFVPTGTPGLFRFCGTSAAAPHAAAVAALELSANPSATVDQVKSAMTGTAAPVDSFGHDAAGAGLVNAFAAVPTLAPALTLSISGPTGRVADRTPTFNLTTDRPASLGCSIDGGATRTCASPFTPVSPLGQGPHTLSVSAADVYGKSAFASTAFTVDTKGPKAKITEHPKQKTHKRKATFKFKAKHKAKSKAKGFQCRLKRKHHKAKKFKKCHSPKKYKHLKPGKYTFKVRAKDDLGNKGKPAKFEWKIKR